MAGTRYSHPISVKKTIHLWRTFFHFTDLSPENRLDGTGTWTNVCRIGESNQNNLLFCVYVFILLCGACNILFVWNAFQVRTDVRWDVSEKCMFGGSDSIANGNLIVILRIIENLISVVRCGGIDGGARVYWKLRIIVNGRHFFMCTFDGNLLEQKL